MNASLTGGGLVMVNFANLIDMPGSMGHDKDVEKLSYTIILSENRLLFPYNT